MKNRVIERKNAREDETTRPNEKRSMPTTGNQVRTRREQCDGYTGEALKNEMTRNEDNGDQATMPIRWIPSSSLVIYGSDKEMREGQREATSMEQETQRKVKDEHGCKELEKYKKNNERLAAAMLMFCWVSKTETSPRRR